MNHPSTTKNHCSIIFLFNPVFLFERKKGKTKKKKKMNSLVIPPFLFFPQNEEEESNVDTSSSSSAASIRKWRSFIVHDIPFLESATRFHEIEKFFIFQLGITIKRCFLTYIGYYLFVHQNKKTPCRVIYATTVDDVYLLLEYSDRDSFHVHIEVVTVEKDSNNLFHVFNNHWTLLDDLSFYGRKTTLFWIVLDESISHDFFNVGVKPPPYTSADKTELIPLKMATSFMEQVLLNASQYYESDDILFQTESRIRDDNHDDDGYNDVKENNKKNENDKKMKDDVNGEPNQQQQQEEEDTDTDYLCLKVLNNDDDDVNDDEDVTLKQTRLRRRRRQKNQKAKRSEAIELLTKHNTLLKEQVQFLLIQNGEWEMRHHHMKADSFWLKVGCVFLGLALFIGQL